MAKIRVLVVDDAVVIRKILTDVLSEDPEIEIVGVAANGKIAVQKLTQVNPDIVTLDVEMPEMNGLETVRKIRETHPKLPIVMFSTLTERGAEVTIEALSAGATDYVTKPANVGNVTIAKERVKSEMLSKIKSLVRGKSGPPPPALKPIRISPPIPSKTPGVAASSIIRIVAIGVSTGGPNALAEVLPALSASFPVPIVIVQHMPPMFTRMLAERLNSICKNRVYEGAQGMKLEAGAMYIAPGDNHMVVVKKERDFELALNKDPQENSCRPAVDPLFRSVVSHFGSGTLGVILTGMGQDGLHGCEHIREAGGQIVAQDEKTSVVWGMPGYVAQAGLADAVLPLQDIALEIERRVRLSSRIAVNPISQTGTR